jgi:hypothetical protein
LIKAIIFDAGGTLVDSGDASELLERYDGSPLARDAAAAAGGRA